MRLNRLLVASPQHLMAFGLAVCLLAQDGLAFESSQGSGEGSHSRAVRFGRDENEPPLSCQKPRQIGGNFQDRRHQEGVG